MKQETIDLLADDFVSSVEDRVADGKVSREEATETYRRLKQLFPTRNLYPSVSWLKSSIEKRRQNGHHEPVLLPGETISSGKKILPAFQKRRP